MDLLFDNNSYFDSNDFPDIKDKNLLNGLVEEEDKKNIEANESNEYSEEAESDNEFINDDDFDKQNEEEKAFFIEKKKQI